MPITMAISTSTVHIRDITHVIRHEQHMLHILIPLGVARCAAADATGTNGTFQTMYK